MAAGRLASSKPAATTNTTLYSCPVGYAASVVLNVCNQSSSATSYRVALRNYTQIITTTGSSHTFNRGNPISTYRLTISPGIAISGFKPGDTYKDSNSKWSCKILDIVKDTSIISVNTKVARVGTIGYTSISPALSSFSVGNTLTDSTNGLTATVLGVNSTSSQVYIQLEPLSTSATTLKLSSAPAYIAAGTTKYLAIPNAQPATSYEIVRVSAWTAGTYTATIVRAQQGTTAATIPVAANAIALTVTATTKTINEGATFTATDAQLTLSNVTGLFTGDYLKIDNEFLLVQTVDSGTSTVGVQRGQLSSTAATHADGATVTRVTNDGTVYVNYFGDTPTPAAATKNYTLIANLTSDFIFSGDATGNDPSITVNIGDTLNFTNNATGAPLHITNAAGAYNVANLVTTGVTNDGATGGTTLTWVTTGLAAGVYYYVNEFQASMQGTITLVTPPTTPTVTNGSGVSARVTTAASTYSSANEFIHDFNNDGNYEWTMNGFSMNLGRIYKFDQTDTTNTGHPFRLSDQIGGTPLYTTGVTTAGTPGSSGAYTQIDLTASSPTVLYSLSSTSGETSYGSTITIVSDPQYTQIYVYDVSATPTVADTFTSGSTTTITQTISAVQPGPYGYVQDFTGTTLKVSLGNKSALFATYTTTVTGTSGQFTITVGANTNLAVGMAVTGTGIGTGAKITNISGTTVTLDIANSGTVSGTGTFNYTFLDTPLTVAGTKTTATVSSVTDIDVADYILYDKAISGNVTDKNTGIVCGPGSSIMVYSTANTLSYVVNGFEDVTSDWTTVQYAYTSQAGAPA